MLNVRNIFSSFYFLGVKLFIFLKIFHFYNTKYTNKILLVVYYYFLLINLLNLPIPALSLCLLLIFKKIFLSYFSEYNKN